ncbi:hypothetical protein IF650_04355 [Cellulosimicrobium terreum]|nr:hypothetical protein [Cellulosimicrobium terreum]
MSTTTERPVVPAPTTPATPAVRRTWEIGLAVTGLVLSTVLLGGFAAVMNGLDEQTFRRDVLPAMTDAGIVLGTAAPYEAARTAAAWFGFTLVAVLATGAAGVYVAWQRPRCKVPGVLLLVAGLTCLLGSQLVLHPVAFLFFVAAALFALRNVPPEERPRRERRKTGTSAPGTTTDETSSVAAHSTGGRR